MYTNLPSLKDQDQSLVPKQGQTIFQNLWTLTIRYHEADIIN